MSLRQLIRQYLNQALLLQIATAVHETPWICTVCFAPDSDFNLYWFSRHDTRHSQEIGANPNVAGAVVLPYVLGDKTRGLQISGEVESIVRDLDVSIGLSAMQKRYHTKADRVEQLRKEIVSGSADYGLYRLRPKTIVLYDSLNFSESPRQEYILSN